MTNSKKKKELKRKTFFEMQEDAWFANNCQGDIEDYNGEEI